MAAADKKKKKKKILPKPEEKKPLPSKQPKRKKVKKKESSKWDGNGYKKQTESLLPHKPILDEKKPVTPVSTPAQQKPSPAAWNPLKSTTASKEPLPERQGSKAVATLSVPATPASKGIGMDFRWVIGCAVIGAVFAAVTNLSNKRRILMYAGIGALIGAVMGFKVKATGADGTEEKITIFQYLKRKLIPSKPKPATP